MCEPLQKLLETNILGDRQSFRTQDQIRGARTTYVTHPELGEPGSGGLTADNYRNPDWARTKEHRGEFRGGLLLAHSGQPVAPQVANMLQQHFNMDVPTIEEEDPNDGEGQPSAGAGAGYSTGNQGTWWSSATPTTSWDSPGVAASSAWPGWSSGNASSSAAAADQPDWSSGAASWWKNPEQREKQSWQKRGNETWWSGNSKPSRW